MSHPDESRSSGPAFEQPDGDALFSEEWTVPLDDVTSGTGNGASSHGGAPVEDLTLPLVDLYPTTDNWAAGSPQQASADHWGAGSGPAQYPGSEATPVPYRTVVQPPVQPGPYAQQPGPYAQQRGPYAQQRGHYMMVPREHPQATTVLVLGAVSIAVPVLSFVAWYMGGRAKAEIDRGAPFPYSGNLRAGHIIGKVMGILTIVGVSAYILFLIAYVVFIVSIFGS